MAFAISLVSSVKWIPNLTPPFKTSFLPPNSPTTAPSLKINPPRRRNSNSRRTPTLTASSHKKIVRYPLLDRHASAHNKLRFAQKLKTLLLSKPRHFLPLRILSRCRSYLSLPPSRTLLSMILRYPSLFQLFHHFSPSSPSLSLLSVSLTPAAASLASLESRLRSQIASSLVSKLQKLLMLSPHRRLLLSKLVHIAPDLGLPPNFRSVLCNAHPHRFRTVDTSYGRALELTSWDSSLAVPLPPIRPPQDPRSKPIIDRPPKFKQLKLRRGLNLKRRHRDFLIRLQDLPDVSPYEEERAEDGNGMTVEMEEKRACAVVREVLGMTVEKRTLVDHLTHFRKDFGLPNRLRAMMVRHPEIFYVSVKGQRDSVFLVEAYDEKGKLVVDDELLAAKERLVELVREGKRMRRERKRGVDGINDDEQIDDDDDEYEDELEDGFGDLFESGIGDDWEEFGAVDCGADVEGGGETGEFWSMKPEGQSFRGEKLEAW